MKKIIITLISILLLCTSNVFGEENEVYEPPTEPAIETAVVIEASEVEEFEHTEEVFQQTQDVKLKITSGKYKNEIFNTENIILGNYAFDIPVHDGDKIVVSIEEVDDGSINVHISDYQRQNHILYLCIVFIVLLILIGRSKGLKAIITLSLTLIAIAKILLPLILKGINPIPVTIIVSISIIVITMLLISGVNNKSFAAIIGTSGGVLFAGIIAFIIGSQIQLTGLSSEEASMLLYIPQKVTLDFKSLLFAGIIMGALGAVMDIAMSIASAMEEIYNANNRITRKELFSSGMNVGRDVMGTMTNTLILAYTGSSIPLLLLFLAYDTPMKKILNLDIIATEIVRSLAGSIGLVLTIPLTALVASLLMKKERNNRSLRK